MYTHVHVCVQKITNTFQKICILFVQHFKMWNMFRHFGVVEGGKRCCQSPTTAQGYRHLPKESTLVTHKHFCFKEKSLSS